MPPKFGSVWLIATIGHIALLFILFWMMFAYAAGSFTDSSATKKVDGVCSAAVALDYPAFWAAQHYKLMEKPVTETNYLARRGMINVVSLLWSPIFGLIVALLYMFYYRIEKYKGSAA